jgi:serine/threonine protein kinase
VSNITDEHPDIHQRMNLFGNLIKDAVRGIAILHQNGWVHTDIRPKNIIVYNNTARLIDWVTAYQLRMGGDCFYHHQGEIDPFAHDSLYEISDRASTSFLPKWDYLSLAYSLFGLSGYFDKLPRERHSEFLAKRREAIQSFIPEHGGSAIDRTKAAAKGLFTAAMEADDTPTMPQITEILAMIEQIFA